MLVNIYYVSRTESDEDQDAAERAQQWGVSQLAFKMFNNFQVRYSWACLDTPFSWGIGQKLSRKELMS